MSERHPHEIRGHAPPGDTGVHFQQVAQSVDSGTLAQGIAAAMRSDETPPFAQLVAQLFESGSIDQKAAAQRAAVVCIARTARQPQYRRRRSTWSITTQASSTR